MTIAFVFPGQGSQSIGDAELLNVSDPSSIRAAVDRLRSRLA